MFPRHDCPCCNSANTRYVKAINNDSIKMDVGFPYPFEYHILVCDDCKSEVVWDDHDINFYQALEEAKKLAGYPRVS